MALRDPLLKLSLVLAALSLSSCGIMFEQAQVRNAFAAHFDCEARSTTSSPGGYRVEGCGTVAFYRCIAPPAGDTLRFDRHTREQSVGAAVFAGFVTGMLEGALSEGECFLEHHRSEPRSELAERESLAPLQPIVVRDAAHTRIRAKVRFLGGQLELLAIPGQYPEQVSLTVRADQRMALDDCQPNVTLDGATLRPIAARALPPYAMRIVVPVESLRGLHKDVQLNGEVCGLRFALGPSELRVLASFEVRRRDLEQQLQAVARN